MKTKVLAVLAGVLFAFAASSSFAAPADKPLAERHGAMWPKSQDGFVTKNQCLMCHGPTYDDLGKKTAKLDPNPHMSHLGEVNCEDCHTPYQAKPDLMCNQCHQFTLRKKEAPAQK